MEEESVVMAAGVSDGVVVTVEAGEVFGASVVSGRGVVVGPWIVVGPEVAAGLGVVVAAGVVEVEYGGIVVAAEAQLRRR